MEEIAQNWPELGIAGVALIVIWRALAYGIRHYRRAYADINELLGSERARSDDLLRSERARFDAMLAAERAQFDGKERGYLARIAALERRTDRMSGEAWERFTIEEAIALELPPADEDPEP